MDLFTEIFSVNIEAVVPKLGAYYKLKIIGSNSVDEIGWKVRYRLQTKFGGHWGWGMFQIFWKMT